jgi:small-conductance mechanosensitive channel
MLSHVDALGVLGGIDARHLLLIVAVLVGARLASAGVTRAFSGVEKSLPQRWRMPVMRFMPLTRLSVAVGAVALIVPLVVEPTAQNVLALLASGSLALAFALKDYGSSMVGALVTVFERPYQPGDWIDVDGTYGEVREIGLRAVHLVTADDTEVVIPHKKLWDTSIHNATSGYGHVLCVADFYLAADHDAELVRATLIEAASTSPYVLPESPVKAIVAEKPWGTHYRLKAYAKDSREQFEFTTDLTIRAKEHLRALGVRPARAPYVPVAAGSH